MKISIYLRWVFSSLYHNKIMKRRLKLLTRLSLSITDQDSLVQIFDRGNSGNSQSRRGWVWRRDGESSAEMSPQPSTSNHLEPELSSYKLAPDVSISDLFGNKEEAYGIDITRQ